MCYGNLIAPSNSCCSFSCVIQSSCAPAEISALVWKAWPFWSCSTLPTSRSVDEPLFLHALSCLYCSISGSDGLTWSQTSSCPAAIIFFQYRFLVTPFTCFQVSCSIVRRTATHLLAASCSVGIPSRHGRSSRFFSRFRRWKGISFSGKTLEIKRGADIEVYGASMFHRRLQHCVGDMWIQDAKVRLRCEPSP
jgi:hypothetical protein